MKFKSATLSLREVTTVQLRKDLTIKVGSLRMGIERDFQRIWPKPAPPIKEVARAGNAPIRDVNHDDPVFVRLFEEWVYYRTIYYFYIAVAGIDTDIEFTNACDSVDSIKRFAIELTEAGLNDFDIGKVVRASSFISTVSDEDVEKATKSF